MIKRRFRLRSSDTTITEGEMVEVTVRQDVMNDLHAGLDDWIADAQKWSVAVPDIIDALHRKAQELSSDDSPDLVLGLRQTENGGVGGHLGVTLAHRD